MEKMDWVVGGKKLVWAVLGWLHLLLLDMGWAGCMKNRNDERCEERELAIIAVLSVTTSLLWSALLSK